MSTLSTTEAILKLKPYRGKLTRQQLRTLKGQILHGDIEGAMRGLQRLTAKDGRNHEPRMEITVRD